MLVTVEDAERDLRALMRRDVPLAYTPQGALADLPLRRSAVLILFGALDRTLAEPRGSRAGLAAPAELDVLLTLRSGAMRHHAGQFAFPGGGVEPGDADAAATALREANEETGLDPAGVDILGALADVHVPVSNNLVTPVIGWWRRPSEVAADHAESVEVFRAPVAELLDPAARGLSLLARDGASFRAPAFRLAPRLGGGIVWGFTGILLASLFDELGWSVPWSREQLFPVSP
ncbi:NUDIX hydrolase [Leucobacter luti]|uniref:NUDIX hydrolase n=1 Tax=Leucobacter luti TaxID=340320 RepID=UPI003CFF25D4